MLIRAALLPLFVHVALVFVLMFRMGFVRRRVMTNGAVSWRDMAASQAKWPPEAANAADAYRNQFELPVLYYAVTLLAILTRQADLIFVMLAWIFVLLRWAQAFVHSTSNHVPTRGGLFAVGAIVLLLMWILLAVDVLVGI